MAENPFMVNKKNRINFLYNYIKSHSPVNYEKVIAVVIYNFGPSRETVKEDIQVLKDLGCIEIKEGKILFIDS